jgi:4-amino-4-deoxy-L-arabinose transferase-like glycosyltransferase
MQRIIHDRFALGAILILALSAMVAFTGIGSVLPLDSHEVFVARSAEEMIARHSFIVPWQNDQPRVKKPPFSYWCVIAVDWINGNDGVITEAEARFPSALAGVIMVGLTIGLGRTLFSPAAGLIAGLLLPTTLGFGAYTHSARPEMMYAMFCTGGILGFSRATRLRVDPPTSSDSDRSPGPSTMWPALFGWLMLGLAFLTKGPQLPVLILAGWIVAIIFNRNVRIGLRSLHALPGLIIFLISSLWWYVALRWALPDVATVWKNETLGRFFSSREPMSRYLDPYYLYRTAQIMLPWAGLFMLAIAAPWLKYYSSKRNAVWLLWWIIAIGMLGLSVSLGRRDYYMLPLCGATAALLAHAGIEAGRALWQNHKAWLWKTLAILHIVGFAAGIVVIFKSEPLITKPPLWAVIATIGVSAVACLQLLRIPARGWTGARFFAPADTVLALPMIVAVVFFVTGTMRGSLASNDRIPRREFSLHVKSLVPPEEPLLGWSDIWEVDQFYTHRVIPSFEERDELMSAIRERLAAKAPACWVLTDTREDPRRRTLKLPNDLISETVISGNPSDSKDSLRLLRISSK